MAAIERSAVGLEQLGITGGLIALVEGLEVLRRFARIERHDDPDPARLDLDQGEGEAGVEGDALGQFQELPQQLGRGLVGDAELWQHARDLAELGNGLVDERGGFVEAQDEGGVGGGGNGHASPRRRMCRPPAGPSGRKRVR
jgi:hypothetical protein